jgi:hypothetical protein
MEGKLGVRSDQRSPVSVTIRAMKGLAAGLLVSLACSAPLLAQERDPALARISLALQQPSPIVRGVDPVQRAAPRTFGIFTLLPPTGRGEMVRVSIPIGDLVSRAFKSVAAANRRRQEDAARRKVEAALDWFKSHQP